MRARTTKRNLGLVVVIGIIAAVVTVAYRRHSRLQVYHAFIQEAYAAELYQLQTTMLQWPQEQFWDEETYSRFEQSRDQLERTFGSGDFYRAGWSYDGHHGAQGTPSPDDGFSIRSWFCAGKRSRGTTYYGNSFGGKRLLVHKMWLPDAPVMKHCYVVLYRDAVDARMAERD